MARLEVRLVVRLVVALLVALLVVPLMILLTQMPRLVVWSFRRLLLMLLLLLPVKLRLRPVPVLDLDRHLDLQCKRMTTLMTVMELVASMPPWETAAAAWISPRVRKLTQQQHQMARAVVTKAAAAEMMPPLLPGQRREVPWVLLTLPLVQEQTLAMEGLILLQMVRLLQPFLLLLLLLLRWLMLTLMLMMKWRPILPAMLPSSVPGCAVGCRLLF